MGGRSGEEIERDEEEETRIRIYCMKKSISIKKKGWKSTKADTLPTLTSGASKYCSLKENTARLFDTLGNQLSGIHSNLGHDPRDC